MGIDLSHIRKNTISRIARPVDGANRTENMDFDPSHRLGHTRVLGGSAALRVLCRLDAHFDSDSS